MLINPEKLVFENPYDVINYVSKGMVPTKKNFDKVISKVRFPDNDDSNHNEKPYIPNRLFIDCDTETMYMALNQVYKNRVRNRNISVGLLAILAAGLLIGGARSKSKSDDKDDFDSVTIDMNEF